MFEETPNRENFQARYVIQHPAYGDFQCAAGRTYVHNVMKRRGEELNELAMLTGWDVSPYRDYAVKFAQFIPAAEPHYRIPQNDTPKQMNAPGQRQKTDTSRIRQESFSAPFYSDDNSNNSATGKLKIPALIVLLLLVILMVVGKMENKRNQVVK
jgi:hypothetical protein